MLTAIFQYYITLFNGDYHDLVIDIHEYEKLMEFRSRDDPEIIVLADLIHDEIDHTVLDLNEAMVISLITFTYPLRQIMSYIFTRLTRRQYVYNAENYVDIVLFSSVLIWVERFYFYHSHHTKHPFAEGETDASNTNFILNIVVDNESGAFHFDYLLAIIGVLFWMRLFFML